ncbi:MAG: hypothetical protein MHM6MM_007138 [Cercozoa sp. M6MM]
MFVSARIAQQTQRRRFLKYISSPLTKVGDVVSVPHDKSGVDVLHDPMYNKGTSFTTSERDRLGLRGLVPPRYRDPEVAARRVMKRYSKITNDTTKHLFLSNLRDRNEVLFYRVLSKHLEDMAPIIYTPTVGQACLDYSDHFRRHRGMFFSASDRGQMHAMVSNWPIDDVRIIVVTDGSRVLGLGDLGANGMGISIGKLSLYTAAAGIHFSQTLPVVIDAGTDNSALLNDPFYIGLPQRRVRGPEFYALVDEFISAVVSRWPDVLVQFEDFSNEHALPLLEKYQHKILCFNDDIQGTGTMNLAGVLGALRVIGHKDPAKALGEQRIVVAGAGTAGLGVVNSMVYGMRQAGMSYEDAIKRFWLVDADGLLRSCRDGLSEAQKPFARDDVEADGPVSLLETVKQVKPTVLLGLSGVGGLFSDQVLHEMSKHCERPCIFPLSNPTSNAECTAEAAFRCSEGRAVFASGSPFDPVVMSHNGGVEQTHLPNQANNMYTFPGIGLGAIACKAKHVTPSMLFKAAEALAQSVTDAELAEGRIFPHLQRIRKVSENIAVAVMKQAMKEDLNRVPMPQQENKLRELLHREHIWEPGYAQMVRPSPS